MAEGGGEEKDENPFSFKKFVNKGSEDSPGRSDDNTEPEPTLDPDLPDVSAPNRRDRRVPDPDCIKTGKDERESNHSNPFSFKKFLQTSSRSASNGTSSSLATLDLAHDLPDFVQDHYSGTCTDSPRSRHRVPPTDVPLPDFALDSNVAGPSVPKSDLPQLHLDNNINQDNSHLNFAHNNIVPPDINDTGPCLDFEHSGARPRTNAYRARSPPVPRLDLNDLQNSDSDEDSHPRICQTNSTGGLPDFLPDSVVSGAGARPKAVPSVLENGLYHGEENEGAEEENLAALVQTLRDENRTLRRELDEARRQAGEEAERVSHVMREKDEFQKKDAEETAALEDIIVQVEANLEKATQRAVTAETTVTKLRQEVKDLQYRLQQLLSQSPGGASKGTTQDKSKYAADQLVSAASTAEVHLKQLLSGVDQLKLLAEILSSGDKVRDLGSEVRTPSQGAEGGADV